MTHQHVDVDPGTLVYDAAGTWVGIVGLRNPHGEYLVVQKGRLFPKDIYLPATAIAMIDGDGVSLHMSKRDLRHSRYGHPPPIADDAPEATRGDYGPERGLA